MPIHTSSHREIDAKSKFVKCGNTYIIIMCRNTADLKRILSHSFMKSLLFRTSVIVKVNNLVNKL